MSRHTITHHDHTWTIGYDQTMATYYAHRQPAYWPPPIGLPAPAPGATAAQIDAANGRQLRELALTHERAMRAAYGPDWRHRSHRNPLLKAVQARHQNILWALIAATGHTPPPSSYTEGTHVDPRPPTSQVSTLFGDRYGEIRGLEDFTRRLRTEHQLELDPETHHALDLERRSHHTEAGLHAGQDTDPPAALSSSRPEAAPQPETREARDLAHRRTPTR